MLNKITCNAIETTIEIQSMMFNPIKKIRKISCCKRVLSIEKIKILNKYPSAFEVVQFVSSYSMFV